jgi:putative transposase
MVAAVRRGQSLRAVARSFHVSVPTVKRWFARAKGKRLDRTSFSDLSSAPRKVANRVSPEIEQLVLTLRKQLKEQSDLGEFGALALQGELRRRKIRPLPCLRTINRILERNGALDYRKRIRRRPPPKGWYLAKVATALAELDEFDFVEGLLIRGGIEVEVCNVVSLHGYLVGSFPSTPQTTESALQAILKHWREVGLPDYAQFDNDTRFQGPHQHPDVIGKVIRVCLSLGVTPVFAPPREHGLQNGIESYNGLWQAKVWGRFEHQSLAGLQEQSARYVAASRRRKAARGDSAPERRKFPRQWKRNDEAKVKGQIIYIRRSDERGQVMVLGRKYEVSANWCHRMVRCEVNIDDKEIRFYGLRRSDWRSQPLLRQTVYELPRRYLE